MSEADRKKWDARYQDAAEPEPATCAWLAPFVDSVSAPLQVLEVACGRGGLALWLSQQGHHVTAVDVSEVALARLSTLAQQRALPLRCEALDLEVQPLPPGAYDLVTCFHFKPPGGLGPLLACVAPGGRLAMETATLVNLERHAHPSRRWLVEPGQWTREVTAAGFECELLQEDWLDGQHLSRVLARRPHDLRQAVT